MLNSRAIALAALAGMAVAVTPVAADGPARADRASYPSIWQGLYGGLHIGSSQGDQQDGLVGGVQVGYNWYYSPKIVYGVEADISLADGDVDWLASIRGRAGYLIDPRLLAYVTAGFGFANNEHGTESDFVLGLGVEGRVNDNTTVRLEYLNYNDLDISVVRAGINVKLGR
jgi:outer membrane immunogenic protein